MVLRKVTRNVKERTHGKEQRTLDAGLSYAAEVAKPFQQGDTMANEQGTGKHPHKSAAEPFEHHEAGSTKSASESKTSSKSEPAKADHSSEEGTGKHPHKKASDPKEHHEGAKK